MPGQPAAAAAEAQELLLAAAPAEGVHAVQRQHTAQVCLCSGGLWRGRQLTYVVLFSNLLLDLVHLDCLFADSEG